MTDPTTKFIQLLDLEPSYWANGKGITRLIASDSAPGQSPADSRSWKLSLATLTEDVNFSALPGVERLFTLASPGPLELQINGGVKPLSCGEQAQFSGSDTVAVQLRSTPQFALNLMTTQSPPAAVVEILQVSGPQVIPASFGYQLLVVLEGALRVPLLGTAGHLTALSPGTQDFRFDAHDAKLAHVRIKY